MCADMGRDKAVAAPIRWLCYFEVQISFLWRAKSAGKGVQSDTASVRSRDNSYTAVQW